MNAAGPLMIMLVVLGIALAICWIFLPFALFGVKGLLREIRDELRELRRSSQPKP